MTLSRKLELIDEYLDSGVCNREWEIMILEYRQMLIDPLTIHKPAISEVLYHSP